jgi:hypothetical protein
MADDWNGDGNADIVIREDSGILRLVPHSPYGSWGLVSKIGGGWSSMTALVAGDFSGDGNVDVVARTASGDLLLYKHAPNGPSPYGFWGLVGVSLIFSAAAQPVFWYRIHSLA